MQALEPVSAPICLGMDRYHALPRSLPALFPRGRGRSASVCADHWRTGTDFPASQRECRHPLTTVNAIRAASCAYEGRAERTPGGVMVSQRTWVQVTNGRPGIPCGPCAVGSGGGFDTFGGAEPRLAQNVNSDGFGRRLGTCGRDVPFGAGPVPDRLLHNIQAFARQMLGLEEHHDRAEGIAELPALASPGVIGVAREVLPR